MSALDTQIGGSHYKSMPIQPMEFSMANNMDACQHTIIKYVARFRDKGGVQDLEKAKHVIDMLIEFEQTGQQKQKSFAFAPHEGVDVYAEMASNPTPAAEPIGSADCACLACQIADELDRTRGDCATVQAVSIEELGAILAGLFPRTSP